MSYQTIPEFRDEGSRTRGRWLLVTLAVVSLLVAGYVFGLLGSIGEMSAVEAEVTARELDLDPEAGNIPESSPPIDLSALSSNMSLPSAPTLDSNQKDEPNDLSSVLLGNDEYVKTFLESLQVSALSRSKAVINGEVYHFGEYVDPGSTVKFQGIRGGVLYFEAGGEVYPYEAQD